MRRESGEVFPGREDVLVSVACSAWLLPRTRRRRHEALRLESQTAVDRSERKHRVAVMPAMPEGQPAPTIAGRSPYPCRPCGGDMGEKGGYRGQQVGAASHTRRQ